MSIRLGSPSGLRRGAWSRGRQRRRSRGGHGRRDGGERRCGQARAHQRPSRSCRQARFGQSLTAESTGEQAGAGLDQLTSQELARFTELNDSYRARFGFPFILAVKGKTKDEILAAFEQRLRHEPPAEFAAALAEIDKIAALRLKDILS